MVNRKHKPRDTVKFMQVLERSFYKRLEKIASEKGITIQELVRVRVIPDWFFYYLPDDPMMISPRKRK